MQELGVYHQVHALAWGDHGLDGRVATCGCGLAVTLAQGVNPDAGGVDNAARFNGIAGAGLRIGAFEPGNLPLFIEKLLGAAVINEQGAVLGCGATDGQRQTGVVKLAVPIFDAAAQALALRGRQELLGLGAAEQLGLAQAGFACELVVQGQAQAVKRRLPPPVAGHDKSQGLGDMGCTVQHRGAFAQGLAHQRNIALGQIAHATVHQLGGARGGAFGKVLRLHQHHLQAARSGV